MKTRIVLLIAISAIATLSFTIVSVKEKPQQIQPQVGHVEAPVGGFLSEGQL